MQNPLTRVLLPLALSAVVFIPAARADEIEAEENQIASTQATLKKILSDTDVPLSLKMKAMDENWRRFIVNAPGGNSEMQVWGAMVGIEFGMHFTKGQTVTMGDDTYLIAYRLPVNIDKRFINWHGHGEAPRPRKPDTETVLNLSLLNLSTMKGLTDVRPFDAKTDMENTSQSNAASVRTLTLLGNGMMRFIRARGQFPTLNNPITWDAKRSFYPYVGDERLFMHPSTQQMYRWNQTLNGKKAVHFKTQQSMAVFYEAENSGDGTRGVLFMDGHVERLQPAHWARVKQASKIQDDGENNDSEVVVAPRQTFNAASNAMTN